MTCDWFCEFWAAGMTQEKSCCCFQPHRKMVAACVRERRGSGADLFFTLHHIYSLKLRGGAVIIGSTFVMGGWAWGNICCFFILFLSFAEGVWCLETLMLTRTPNRHRAGDPEIPNSCWVSEGLQDSDHTPVPGCPPPSPNTHSFSKKLQKNPAKLTKLWYKYFSSSCKSSWTLWPWSRYFTGTSRTKGVF